MRQGTLVVLCGIAGSGKSSFAEKHFIPTAVVSTDACRAMLSDDPGNQSISHWAFELAFWIADQRLFLRRTTVLDSTALRKRVRRDLLKIAQKRGAPTLLLCFDISLEECLRRNSLRERSVAPEVIVKQHESMQAALHDAQREGWDRIVVLDEEQAASASVVQPSGSFDLRYLRGPFDVIGDLHGCTDELFGLLSKLGYEVGDDLSLSHPEGRTLILLGDLGDRGPHNAQAFELAMKWVSEGSALYTPGNHCAKLLRYLQGKQVSQDNGLADTTAQVEAREAEEPGFKARLAAFIAAAPSYLWLDGGALVVAHGGIKEEMIGHNTSRVKAMCLYGDVTGEKNPDGTPVRLDWAADYRGEAAVVYGHTPAPGPLWRNNTVNIDQGCVFGGRLTGLRWPERDWVQVPARRAYYTGRTPAFLAERVRELTGGEPSEASEGPTRGHAP